MEKFNSQICTTREQSERLLALGLKKETADMAYLWYGRAEDDSPLLMDKPSLVYQGIMTTHDLPAWSLHRLIEMMPRTIKANDDLFFLLVSKEDVFYDNTEGTAYSSFIHRNGLYYNIISCIEWLIKEGHLNKAYLV